VRALHLAPELVRLRDVDHNDVQLWHEYEQKLAAWSGNL